MKFVLLLVMLAGITGCLAPQPAVSLVTNVPTEITNAVLHNPD
ncbi:MAG: hypothetical protein JWQ71_2354, partial [Pedosphaera sp.]|nr:hypothetical protein [Pedosphaera sp.]